jgi:hypothetical protein
MVGDGNKDTHHGGSKLPCFERQDMIYQIRITPVKQPSHATKDETEGKAR